MSRPRVIRCAACTRRIKPHHAHIGLIDHESGREISYHASPCNRCGAEEMASLLTSEAGRAYTLRHYHSSRCPDKTPSWGCSGGCFDTPGFRAAVAN